MAAPLQRAALTQPSSVAWHFRRRSRRRRATSLHAGTRQRYRRSFVPEATPVLAVNALVKHYPVRGGLFAREVGMVQAVDGVSVDLAARGTLGLGGGRGCGKSTNR